MEVTKEIYEKVVEICEEDYDLAHDVVMKLYDCEEICHPITTVIKILKKRILDKRSKEPNMEYIDLNEEEFTDLMLNMYIHNEFADLEKRILREKILEIINSDYYSLDICKKNKSRDHAIVLERFFDGKTYKEIGSEFGLCRSRVGSIIDCEIRRMRHQIFSQQIKDFFIWFIILIL